MTFRASFKIFGNGKESTFCLINSLIFITILMMISVITLSVSSVKSESKSTVSSNVWKMIKNLLTSCSVMLRLSLIFVDLESM